MRRRRVTGVAIFRLKAIGRQLALAPIGTPPMLGRQLKTCTGVCDYTLHLLAGRGSPYLQYDRQRNDGTRRDSPGRFTRFSGLAWPLAFLDGEVSASDGGGSRFRHRDVADAGGAMKQSIG